LSVTHRPPNKFVHEVQNVEIMAPCYSKIYWSECLWPLLHEYNPLSGWGVDAYLGRVSCAPKKYSVRLPLDHEDTKSLQSDPKVQAINEAELNEARKVAESNGFPSPTGTSSYSVHVDEDCKLQLVD